MFKRAFFFLSVLAALTLAVGSVAAAGQPQTFIVSVDNIAAYRYTDSGVFSTPVGAASAGPALPGDAYSWDFHASPGDRLSFATMFVQSNDWFFAPDERGIPLYDAAGTPLAGDVTGYVRLWDAGTEGDEAVASGAYQAPRQPGPDSGPSDPNANVRQVLSAALPPVSALVRVTLSAGDNGQFTVRIDNVSGASAVPTPLAPGVGVVHNAPAPLFINGQPDWGLGLEALAEDGAASGLADYLAGLTGVNTPLAPVAWAVHTMPNALFAAGAPASIGLETLAEDGSPVLLIEGLDLESKGAAAVGRGSTAAGPIFAPHGNYQFEITAMPGERLSLATMFVQSNDWFFGLRDLPLFDAAGNPLSGNVTHHIRLYDAGTEVDQTPGFGPDQAPRQSGANTGAVENGVVTAVPGINPAGVIHVTVTPVW